MIMAQVTWICFKTSAKLHDLPLTTTLIIFESFYLNFPMKKPPISMGLTMAAYSSFDIFKGL